MDTGSYGGAGGGPDGVVYMNNAATTFPKTRVTVDAFLAALAALPGGNRHGAGDKLVERARIAVARALYALPAQVFFFSGATLAINVAVSGVVAPGAACLVDNRSHNAIVRTVANAHLNWRVLPLYDLMDRPDFTALRDACAAYPRPKLICLTHASNVTGSVYDVGEIVSRIRKHLPDTVVLVDAAQSAGAVSLEELVGADIVVFPSHKHLYGPVGAAALVSRVQLRPTVFGGTGRASARVEVDSKHWQGWLEVGTPDVPAIAALEAGLDDFRVNGSEHTRRELEMLDELLAELARVDELELLKRCPFSRRTATVSYRSRCGDPETEWAVLLRHAGVIVRGGLHCSPLHHAQLGLSNGGTLRFSLGRFNSLAEVRQVGELARDIGRSLRMLS